MARAAKSAIVVRQIVLLARGSELERGSSQRAIAVLVGVSKSTVQRVLAGTHCAEVSESLLASGESRQRPAVRCGRCGSLLDVIPCRVCPSMEAAASNKFAAAMHRGEARHGPRGRRHALSLNLTADQADRLATVHARRKRKALAIERQHERAAALAKVADDPGDID